MHSVTVLVLAALALPSLLLAGCDRRPEVNPPTEPARAIDQPDVAPEATGSSGGRVAGTGPASFVGRWATDVSSCTGPKGTGGLVQITPSRFESAARSCHIYSVDQSATGYLAVLQCQANDPTRQERVHLAVVGQILTLTWLDQGEARVSLHKCTTLADVAPTRTGP